LNVPFVSANLRDGQGQLVAEPLRIVERGGRRVALAGVLSRRFAGEGIQVDDPREALLQATAAVKGRYDSLVVLAYLPVEELEQLAAGLPEADVMLGGPTGQSIPPRSIGPTLLAAATNKGKFLVHLESNPGSSRLAWTGKVVEMDAKLDDDPEQKENLRRFHEELGRRDFPAAQAGLAALLPAGLPRDYRLAGTASCQTCHKQDCKVWEESKHAHAWETLNKQGSHIDPQCQLCHTTGYGLPGGFESIALSRQAVSVGCESCHGPSQAHTRRPEVQTAFTARDQCVRCHDHENSPEFKYEAYWPQIRHGVRVGADARSKNPE
jgi:hypothetical protein